MQYDPTKMKDWEIAEAAGEEGTEKLDQAFVGFYAAWGAHFLHDL